MICFKFTVSGKVQGVGFRWYTCEQASRYQIKGWVRNRKDGKVEGVAQGEEPSLQLFLQALEVGPPSALVSSLESKAVPIRTDLPKNFQPRY